MANTSKTTNRRPLNIVTAKGSSAERFFLERAGLPGAEAPEPEAIAPGLRPRRRHDLIFHGGKTIADLTFTNLFVGGSSSWQKSDIQNIDSALAAAMSDRDLNNVMMQYFGNRPISTTFKPSQILSGSKPSSFSQGDVENLVTQLHSQGRLQGFDLASTVFDFMLPSGTVLTTDAAPAQQSAATASAAARKGAPEKAQRGEGAAGRNPAHPEDEASSLAGLGGYHGSVHAGEDTIYYAVGVFSETLPNGRDNGIVAFDQPWKDVVATFYHELNEARTDADVEDAIKARAGGAEFLGWMSRQGEECGDFPIFEAGPALDLVMQEVLLTNGSTTVPVQFQFSNAVHGPEGPIAAPHTTLARARARSRRLRKLHQRRALNARRRRVRRALRALRQGRLRMARRIESKLFRGKKLKSLAVRRRRLRFAAAILATTNDVPWPRLSIRRPHPTRRALAGRRCDSRND